MERPRAMLCLAGRQVMPNAIAARQMDIGHLLILHTAHATESAEPAARLAAWFSNGGGTAACKELGQPDDLSALGADMLRWLSHRYDWVINVTGGTKLMSLAAVAAGLECKARVCYVDTPHERLLWLGAKPSTERLTTAFSIAEVLGLHGQEIYDRGELTAERLSGARLLAALRPITTSLAAECLHNTWQPGLCLELAAGRASDDQVHALCRVGLVEAHELLADGSRSLALTHEGWEQVRGSWLEVLAAEGLRQAGAHEVVTSLKVPFHHDPAMTKSEADAAGVLGSSLVVAECKAGGKLKREDFAALGVRAPTLGGSMALAVMVWAPAGERPPAESQLQQYLEQASEHGVLLCVGHRPEELAAAVKQRLGER